MSQKHNKTLIVLSFRSLEDFIVLLLKDVERPFLPKADSQLSLTLSNLKTSPHQQIFQQSNFVYMQQNTLVKESFTESSLEVESQPFHSNGMFWHSRP